MLDGVVAAVASLEDDPITNAGYGSNLTEEGRVECDASVMEGARRGFGAIGAVSGVKNPVVLAKELAVQEQRGPLSAGRLAPIFLVAHGAYQWARRAGLTTAESEEEARSYLISPSAHAAWHHAARIVAACHSHSPPHHPVVHCSLDTPSKRRRIGRQGSESGGGDADESREGGGGGELHQRLDTVGAICCDSHGNTAAAVSSGGVLLKVPGRVGQAGVYGCGCWAANLSCNSPAVACSTSGAGEDLIKCMLARSFADAVAHEGAPDEAVRRLLQDVAATRPGGVQAGLIALKAVPQEPEMRRRQQSPVSAPCCDSDRAAQPQASHGRPDVCTEQRREGVSGPMAVGVVCDGNEECQGTALLHGKATGDAEHISEEEATHTVCNHGRDTAGSHAPPCLHVELTWAHTTPSIILAYAVLKLSQHPVPNPPPHNPPLVLTRTTTLMSRLSASASIGHTVTVGGATFVL